jgi:hypothetical protein
MQNCTENNILKNSPLSSGRHESGLKTASQSSTKLNTEAHKAKNGYQTKISAMGLEFRKLIFDITKIK